MIKNEDVQWSRNETIYWILSVLVMSFLPYIAIILIDGISGYGIKISKHIPDYLLIVISICLNTLLYMSEQKKMNESKHYNGALFLFILVIINYGLYFGLFNELASVFVWTKINSSWYILGFFWFFGAVCLFIDFKLECHSKQVEKIAENEKKVSEEAQEQKKIANQEKIREIQDMLCNRKRIDANEINTIKEILGGLEL